MCMYKYILYIYNIILYNIYIYTYSCAGKFMQTSKPRTREMTRAEIMWDQIHGQTAIERMRDRFACGKH